MVDVSDPRFQAAPLPGDVPVPLPSDQSGRQERRSASRRRSDVGLEVMEAIIKAGVVGVERDLSVQLITERARLLLNGGNGIEIREGRFHVERTSVKRRLQEMVERLLGGGTQSPQPGTLIGIPNNDGRVRFAVKVVPLAEASGQRLALLAIVDLLRNDSVQRTAVAALFGLSDREAELADHFSKGLRIDEIASAMGIAPNTARVHLRSVFVKTGCTSQIELARIFALVP